LRRNQIELVVREDIRLLGWFLALLRPLFSEYTRNSIEAVLAAFRRTILKEVDMQAELANLERFRQAYADCGIRMPVPFPEVSSPDALVMSFEDGCRFDDREGLTQLEVSFAGLMEKLVLFYTEQMLVKGFFHADPHPGNLLVTPRGELVLLDFGMVSRIPNATRLAMINMVKAAYERDYELLVDASRKMVIITNSVPQHELGEEDRRDLLRSLHHWLLQLAWVALLVALAFYLKGADHPAAGWLSFGRFGAAVLRLFWRSRAM